MKQTVLILMLLTILPVSACGDDPAESSEPAGNRTAAEHANQKSETESVSEVAPSRGDGPRLCSSAKWDDDTYLCFRLTTPNVKFRQYVPVLAKRAKMTEAEFIEANGWGPYLDDIIQTDRKYLYFVTQEGYVEFVNGK